MAPYANTLCITIGRSPWLLRRRSGGCLQLACKRVISEAFRIYQDKRQKRILLLPPSTGRPGIHSFPQKIYFSLLPSNRVSTMGVLGGIATRLRSMTRPSHIRAMSTRARQRKPSCVVSFSLNGTHLPDWATTYSGNRPAGDLMESGHGGAARDSRRPPFLRCRPGTKDTHSALHGLAAVGAWALFKDEGGAVAFQGHDVRPCFCEFLRVVEWNIVTSFLNPSGENYGFGLLAQRLQFLRPFPGPTSLANNLHQCQTGG